MNRNILMYLSLALILLIPVPGRFAYGIIMVVEFLLLMILGILFRRLVKKIRVEEFKGFLIPLAMVAASVLFKQILIMISPIMAFTLGFAIYMPAVSAFLMENISDESNRKPVSEIKKAVTQTLSIAAPVLIVYLVRDLVGYGTFTLPAKHGLFVLHAIPEIQGSFLPTVFLASIPGTFLLLAISILIVTKIGLKWTKNSDTPVMDEQRNDNANGEDLNQIMDKNLEQNPLPAMESPLVQETKAEENKEQSHDFEKLRGLDTSNLSDSLTFPDAPSLLNLDDIMGDNYGN